MQKKRNLKPRMKQGRLKLSFFNSLQSKAEIQEQVQAISGKAVAHVDRKENIESLKQSMAKEKVALPAPQRIKPNKQTKLRAAGGKKKYAPIEKGLTDKDKEDWK
jgi:hypothetical protein